MKILLINTNDIEGGAARAVYRFHAGMREAGIDSNMLVQNKTSDDNYVQRPKKKITKAMLRVSKYFDSLPLRLYFKRDIATWSIQWLHNNMAEEIGYFQPDIVHLHWIGGGFIPVSVLAKLQCPIIWTLHDMWAFTGGCHYDRSCGRYNLACGRCPQLKSKVENDLSRLIWERKKHSWKNTKITVVTPSNWLAKCTKASSLFKDYPVKVIPYGLNLKDFRPIAKELARNSLGISNNKKLILFGAHSINDPRKGFGYLQRGLSFLAKNGWKDRVEVGIFGKRASSDLPDLGLRVNCFGGLRDDINLSLLYSAADVFVCPSLQDNLPNTVIEALACATPCVAFNVGGIPDLIEHKINGYLARPFEVDDLVQGITWVLHNNYGYDKLTFEARHKAEQKFSLELQIRSYMELYRAALESKT